MADAEPPFELRLRADGAGQRDLYEGGHGSPDAEVTLERGEHERCHTRS